MAVVSCNECKKEVSDEAKACPHCGYTGIIKDRKRAETDAVMATKFGKISYSIFLCLIALGLYSCVSDLAKSKAEYKIKYKKCLEKGEEHFKSIGSWPNLSNGSDASAFVVERCSRGTGSYGE